MRSPAVSMWFLFAALGAPVAAASAAPERLFAGGSWAALRFGATCEAASRPLPPARTRSREARAGFSFDALGSRRGDFYVRLSRAARAGSSVMLTVGRSPFLLAARGDWAWSRNRSQSDAIIAAVRSARGMRVDARDGSGRRLRDIYDLAGAPTAIDAAAAACSRRR